MVGKRSMLPTRHCDITLHESKIDLDLPDICKTNTSKVLFMLEFLLNEARRSQVKCKKKY